mmetsp:Transcript_33504/g.51466  ORF Transcript_33504/g.51466 Transcript_33504/m.51466 type:complete len:198 (+) Transcript_33504:324-917(+)
MFKPTILKTADSNFLHNENSLHMVSLTDGMTDAVIEHDMYYVSRKQHKNLEKIFNLYAQQHMPTKIPKQTFDEIEKFNKKWLIGDFLKFCKDFQIPLPKIDQKEVFRRKVIRPNKSLTFEHFLDLIRECFYFKEMNKEISEKEAEIKYLEESNFIWSVENRKKLAEDIRLMRNGERDPLKDPYYLHQAHSHLQTDND